MAAFALAVPAAAQDGAAAVEGVVTREGGGPLVGASIELWDASGVTASGTTDAEGRFHVDAPAAGAYWLHASDACCTRQIHNVTIGSEGTTVQDVVLWPQTTQPAGASVLLWGRMADPHTGDPTPWVGLSAGLTDGSFSAQTASRADGSYFLELPAGSVHGMASRIATASTSFELHLAADTYLDIPVYLDGARLDLHVVSGSEQSGADGRLLEACGEPACAPIPAESEDGTFAFTPHGGGSRASIAQGFEYTRTRATPGLWEFTADAPGHAPAAARLTIQPGDVWKLEARLVEGEAERFRVSGQVVADGTAIEGVPIDARNEAVGESPSVPPTDEAGEYSFMIRPGLLRIEARPHPNVTEPAYGSSFYPASRTLWVDGDRGDVDFTLVAKRAWPDATVELVGWVVDGDAETGVADAKVIVRNEDSLAWGEARTDADGAFRFDVPAGYYRMAALVHDGTWVLQSVAAEAGRAWVNLTYRAPPAPTGDGWYGALVQDFYVPGSQPTATPTPSPSPEPEPEWRPLTSEPSSPTAEQAFAVEGSASYAGQAGGLGPYTPSEAPDDAQDDDRSDAQRPTTDVPFPSMVVVLASAVFAAALAWRPPRR